MYWLSKKGYMALMLVPTLLIYIVYMIAPIGVAVGYSFTKYSGIGKASFNGIDNYIRLFKDATFLVSLKNTFVIFAVAFTKTVLTHCSNMACSNLQRFGG